MPIPTALIDACERNKDVWHRESPEDVARAFGELGLKEDGEFFEFLSRYCLQFYTSKIDFEFEDVVDDDGDVSEMVSYAGEELGVDPSLLPISTYEAESLYAVDTKNGGVVYLTSNQDGEWDQKLISPSFYTFMLEVLS